MDFCVCAGNSDNSNTLSHFYRSLEFGSTFRFTISFNMCSHPTRQVSVSLFSV